MDESEKKEVFEEKDSHQNSDTINENTTQSEGKKNETESVETLEENASFENNENEKSKDEILTEEINQLKDEKLRLLAEMDNLRKRMDREKTDSVRYGSMNFARDILSPGDNLARALEAIPKEEKNSKTIINLIDGLKMVQKEFAQVLEKHGVTKINSLNEKFDHNFHQAMMELENDKVEEGIVVQEIQSGYTMYDRLLRPAMVGVSKKPEKTKKNKKNK